MEVEKENIGNDRNGNEAIKKETDSSQIVPHNEATDIDMDDDTSNVENIDNASSSSQGGVTRENSVEKDDVGTSSPEETNEDNKSLQVRNNTKNRSKDESKELPRSLMEPPDSSKMSVKDRMAIGRFQKQVTK